MPKEIPIPHLCFRCVGKKIKFIDENYCAACHFSFLRVGGRAVNVTCLSGFPTVQAAIDAGIKVQFLDEMTGASYDPVVVSAPKDVKFYSTQVVAPQKVVEAVEFTPPIQVASAPSITNSSFSDKILRVIKTRGVVGIGIGKKEICAHSGATDDEYDVAIAALKSANLIIQTGIKRGTKYYAA